MMFKYASVFRIALNVKSRSRPWLIAVGQWKSKCDWIRKTWEGPIRISDFQEDPMSNQNNVPSIQQNTRWTLNMNKCIINKITAEVIFQVGFAKPQWHVPLWNIKIISTEACNCKTNHLPFVAVQPLFILILQSQPKVFFYWTVLSLACFQVPCWLDRTLILEGHSCNPGD